MWIDSTMSFKKHSNVQHNISVFAALKGQYHMNYCMIYPGGMLKQCNDQLLKWLVLFGVLDWIGHEGGVIMLEQSTHSSFNIVEGNPYKQTEETCLMISSLSGIAMMPFPVNKVEAKAGGISNVEQPFPHVQQALWDQVKLLTKLIPLCPYNILNGPGCGDVWEAPGFQPAIASVFKFLNDFVIAIVNPLYWYNTLINWANGILIIQLTTMRRQHSI